MSPEEVRLKLCDVLAETEIHVEKDGSHYLITAIGELFVGKRPVQRQQLIYAALSNEIADGHIHAVHMRIFTPEEWQRRSPTA
ncbi:MAG TPA: cell division protein BolA [Porticoccaceae bacterium]|nr:cell division protein BolA [Porticoccaceae bacterium]|tara:strand:+ start:194 stop:442 length:249 start_codon:yes stop_codon:yes gene_type:complete